MPSRRSLPTALLALGAAAAGACANQVQSDTCVGRGLRNADRSAQAFEASVPTFNVVSKDEVGSGSFPPTESSQGLFSSGFVTLALGKDPYATARAENALLKDRDVSTCSATFRFRLIDGAVGAQVTTAAHCFRGMLALVDGFKVEVFDPESKKYFQTLEAWSPYLEKRRAMLAELQKAGFSAGVREVTAWDFLPGIVGISRDGEFDIGRICGRGSDYDSNFTAGIYDDPAAQTLCFSGSDLVHFDLVFQNGAKGAPADFLSFAKALIAAEPEKLARLPEGVPAVTFAKAQALHERRVKNARGLMESSMGNMLDAITVACSGKTFEELGGKDASPLSLGGGGGGNPLAALDRLFALKSADFESYKTRLTDACKRKPEYFAIAEKHMRYAGLKPSEVLSQFTLKNPITDIQNRYVLEDAATGSDGVSMAGPWDELMPLLMGSPRGLKAHFNLQDKLGNPLGPVTVPVQEIGRAPALTRLLWPKALNASNGREQAFDALFVNVPNSLQRFTFSAGDSGTVVSLGDAWPLFVLAGAEGAPTSGGASVVALPRRGSSAGGSGSGGTAASDKAPSNRKETSDSSTGCGAT